MRSMTAFGRAQTLWGDRTLCVEIRSVNSRFLDCNVRSPRVLSMLEMQIKPYLQSRGISRGKVDVTVTLTGGTAAGGRLTLDLVAAREYLAALECLRDELGLRDDISVMQLAQRGELFVRESEELDAVDICTPNNIHSQAAVFALENGLNVICEKPDAVSVVEAEKMKAAAEKSGKTLMVIRNNRFRPSTKYVAVFLVGAVGLPIKHSRVADHLSTLACTLSTLLCT